MRPRALLWLLATSAAAATLGCQEPDDPCDEIDDPALRAECNKIPAFDCSAREDFAEAHGYEVDKRREERRVAKPLDRYIGVVAKGSPALAFARPPHDLWPPFRWEATFGLYDPSIEDRLANGIFGTELDARGSSPLQFYGIYGRRISGGLQVFVSSHAGNHGQTFFAGAFLADVVIEHDGADLVFLARRGDTRDPYAEVARIPLPSPQFPLNPGIGVFNTQPLAKVGFDHLRVVRNGTPPVPVSEAHAATNALCEAFGPLAHAYDALDRQPLPEVAVTDLGATLAAIAEARAAIEAIPPPPAKKPPNPVARALKELRKAETAATKARKILEKKGLPKAEAARKKMIDASEGLVRAGDWILPDELRDSLPGGTKSLHH